MRCAFTSKPMTRAERPKATATGRPTYPRPTTEMRRVWLGDFIRALPPREHMAVAAAELSARFASRCVHLSAQRVHSEEVLVGRDQPLVHRMPVPPTERVQA